MPSAGPQGETTAGTTGSLPAGATRSNTRVRSLVWALGWPFRFVLIAVIRSYQRFVSPMFAPSCRYYPVCSSYGLKAIQRHGAAKGSVLTAWRLMRCNPWSGGGLDPVPAEGRWRPDITPDGRPRMTPPERRQHHH